jgi:DNA-binding response OmpR family regulator
MSPKLALHILVVEDYPLMRDTLRRVFSRQGWAVTEASDGEEALQKLASDHFDAILLDEHMPGPSGLEVLRQARQGGCQAAILLLTADSNPALAVQAIKAGADDFVSKPFEPEELVALVRRYASGRRRLEAEADAVVAYVRAHFPSIKGREEAARALGLSERTASRHVAKVTGLSFPEFLCQCRLEKAQELLRTTDLDVGQIADRVGFGSLESFTHAFRRQMHVSPREYRLAVRAQRAGEKKS